MNGNHVLFATAKSQSGLEGTANGGVITFGRSVSSYVNVTFDNLISEIGFSQPYFEPSLGQTQQVTATFGVNCDWTLHIIDAGSNIVRAATGTGTAMEFDWNGTGTGSTNIPDGVYYYVISAVTNSSSLFAMSESMSFSSLESDSDTNTELYAADESGSIVPLTMYPPNFDTNGLTIFAATKSDIQSLRPTFSTSSMSRSSSFSGGSFTSASRSGGGGGGGMQMNKSPERKPNSPVKGTVGTFGICYKTYSTNGFASAHPATGFPFPLPTLVGVDGQSRTAQTVDYTLLEYKTIATEFSEGMQRAAWKPSFIKRDDQWGANDIKKASLGGSSIFNTVNFGLLMTHGSFGNHNSTGSEADGVSYTYFWLGAANYVRLSDMDFGSSDTNGLKWMTIYACSILTPQNYNSMNNNGRTFVNENLHLLVGPSTPTYAWDGLGTAYSRNLTEGNQEIFGALNTACNYLSHLVGSPITIKHAASGWLNCMHDKLNAATSPDPDDGLQYQEVQIYP